MVTLSDIYICMFNPSHDQHEGKKGKKLNILNETHSGEVDPPVNVTEDSPPNEKNQRVSFTAQVLYEITKQLYSSYPSTEK